MTDSPSDELVVPVEIEMSNAERAWLRKQERKSTRTRLGGSKYIPHQGTRERARRLRQVEARLR